MVTITVLPAYEPGVSYATGGGDFEFGDIATLEAFPDEGFVFTYWTDSSGKIFGELANPIRVTVEREETFTAHFAYTKTDPEDEGDDPSGEKPEYTVTVTCEHPGEGIVTGGGVYEQGDTCTITAKENSISSNHKFVGWQNPDWENPNGAVLKKRVHSFEVFDDETWVAIFDDMGPEGYPDWTDEDEEWYEDDKRGRRRIYTVTVECDQNLGSVSGGGSYYAGEACTISATPYTKVYVDCKFIQWARYENGSLVEIRTGNPYSFTVYNDTRWYALFGTCLIMIRVTSNITILDYDGGNHWYTAAPFIFRNNPSQTPKNYVKFTRYNKKHRSQDSGSENYPGLIFEAVACVCEAEGECDSWNIVGAETAVYDINGPKYGFYFPLYAKNLITGKIIKNDVKMSDWKYGYHYSYAALSFEFEFDVNTKQNQFWYFHFVRIDGKILRNANDNILRKSVILRGNS